MIIKWLENWCENQCDGKWEHGYGIRIITLDNPGWDITISLDGTNIELPEEEWKLFEKSESDWYGYKVSNNTFYASGDSSKIELLINLFKNKIDSGGGSGIDWQL